jgi:hypothetical protein
MLRSRDQDQSIGAGLSERVAVLLDMDTVLLAAHREPRGVELGVQADLAEGLERLAEVADAIVVLAFPENEASALQMPAEQRIEALAEGLGSTMERLPVIGCPHGDEACDCAKPGVGLIEVAVERLGLATRGSWLIGGDQEGMVAGRSAGLRTVRIGPPGDDPMSSIHRPDIEARDLLDAANQIMVELLV